MKCLNCQSENMRFELVKARSLSFASGLLMVRCGDCDHGWGAQLDVTSTPEAVTTPAGMDLPGNGGSA